MKKKKKKNLKIDTFHMNLILSFHTDERENVSIHEKGSC